MQVASLSRAALDKTPDQWCAWQDLVLASTQCQQSVPGDLGPCLPVFTLILQMWRPSSRQCKITILR